MNRLEPNRNVYVGHRYVPLLVGEWDKSIQYEGLSIVTFKGASYTSKKMTPAGIDIENEEFWVVTGNYNAQVEYYRQETEQVRQQLHSKASVESLNDFKEDTEDNFENVNNDLKELGDVVSNTILTVKDYGAMGDGLNDDTIHFKNIIENENEFHVPKGVYLITDTLFLKLNTKITMSHDAIIKISVNKDLFVISPGSKIEGGTLDFSLINENYTASLIKVITEWGRKIPENFMDERFSFLYNSADINNLTLQGGYGEDPPANVNKDSKGIYFHATGDYNGISNVNFSNIKIHYIGHGLLLHSESSINSEERPFINGNTFYNINTQGVYKPFTLQSDFGMSEVTYNNFYNLQHQDRTAMACEYGIKFGNNKNSHLGTSDNNIFGLKIWDIRTDDVKEIINEGNSNKVIDRFNTSSTVTVSAYNSYNKTGDLTCSGVNDQEVILKAIEIAKNVNGRVFLMDGTFNFDNSLQLYENPGVNIEGMGKGTIIKFNKNNTYNSGYLIGYLHDGSIIKNLTFDMDELNIDGILMNSGISNELTPNRLINIQIENCMARGIMSRKGINIVTDSFFKNNNIAINIHSETDSFLIDSGNVFTNNDENIRDLDNKAIVSNDIII